MRMTLLLFFFSLFFYSCQELELLEEPDETGTLTPDLTPTLLPTPTSPITIPGPMNPVDSIPYIQINTNEYVIEIDRWDIPNDRREPVKTTDNIQAAIDWAVTENYGIIRLPAGHYLIGKYGNQVYQAGITLPSNVAFLLDKDAILEMTSNDKWNYCVITVTKQKNVLISGGTIIGDKDTHTYTPRESDGKTNHDEGHCVCIQTSSENVTVQNMTLKNATGDGVFLIAQGAHSASVKNINITTNNIGHNRRQGISIVGAQNVLIENNEIHHIKGIAPQYGIDIESYPYKTKNVIIRANYFHNNIGHILNFDGIDTLIENNYMEQGNDLEKHIDAPLISWNKANVVFRNNMIALRTQSRVSNWNGFIFYAYDIPNPNIKLNEIYDNVFIKCGIFMQNHKNGIIRDNSFDFGHIAMKNMDNVKIFNNALTHDNECWPFRLQNVTGLATGNKYNGKDAIGLDLNENTPFTGACQEKEQ